MRLKEIMSTDVKTVNPNESAAVAWRRMRSFRIRHLVVVEQDAVVGVISERDLGGAKGEDVRDGKLVNELMSPQVTTATPETTVRRAANQMRGSSIGCLPVLAGSKLVGVVTIADLLDVVAERIEHVLPKAKRWTVKHRVRPRERQPNIG